MRLNPARVARQATLERGFSGGNTGSILTSIRRGNIGTRMHCGRMERDFDNTSLNTWEDLIAVSAEFDAFRCIWAQSRNAGATTAAPVMLASVAALPDTLSATADAAAWTNASVAASGTWTLTAGPAQQRRAFVISDWVAVPSVKRTDNGSFSLIGVRSWVNGGAGATPLTLIGNSTGTDSFANWATKPDGRIWKRRRAAGNFASANQANFGAAAVTANESPLVGVQYAAKGKIITVFSFGDSNMDGRGTYIGEGFGARATWGMSGAAGVAWEYGNLAWAGAGTGVQLNALNDLLATVIRPDIALLQSGNPNDIATTISAANISAQQFRLAQCLAACKTNGVEPLLIPFMPSANSIKAYGATDSLRAAYMADVEARSGSNLVMPFSTVFAATTHASGQIEPLAADMPDGIHLGEASGIPKAAEALMAQFGRIN